MAATPPKKAQGKGSSKSFKKQAKSLRKNILLKLNQKKKQELEKFEKTEVTEKEEEFEKHEESEKHEEFEKHAEFEEKQEIKDLLPPDEEMTEKENLEPELSERLSPIEVVKDSLDTTEIHEKPDLTCFLPECANKINSKDDNIHHFCSSTCNVIFIQNAFRSHFNRRKAQS